MLWLDMPFCRKSSATQHAIGANEAQGKTGEHRAKPAQMLCFQVQQAGNDVPLVPRGAAVQAWVDGWPSAVVSGKPAMVHT